MDVDDLSFADMFCIGAGVGILLAIIVSAIGI
jgi:hypothetical protein